MLVTLIVGISLLLQIITIYYSLTLITITGWKKAWICLSIAIVTMGVRRFITFLHLLGGDALQSEGMLYELLGLAGSLIMLAGVLLIRPIFLSLRNTEEELKESEAKLFRFLETLPVGVFITDHNGKPYYSNKTSFEMLGRGILPGVNSDNLAEVYQTYIAGTEEKYPAEKMPVIRALSGVSSIISDMEIRKPTGSIFLEVVGTPLYDETGVLKYAIAVFSDMTARRKIEEEREVLIFSLKEALSNIKILRGILPICASCKKIRDDKGYWNQVESYIRDHSNAEFSHGICPDCAKNLYPDFFKK
jgi:PAS domain S-box-containing protein